MSGRLRTVWLRDAAYDIENSFPATCSLIIEAAQEIDDLRDRIDALEREIAHKHDDEFTVFMSADHFDDDAMSDDGGALVFRSDRTCKYMTGDNRVVELSVRPNLPDAPALFGKPVPIPEPRRGQDARVFAAATRKAALEANQRLRDDAEFYRDVQTSFGNAVQDETKNDR